MKTSLWITVLVICLSASVLLQRWIDAQRGAGSAVEEALYLKSGKTLKQASLGFEGILADLYWLRTIQYFGGKSQQLTGEIKISNVGDWKLELLEPLINITTELDPHYLSAYRFGSLFLPDINVEGAIKLGQRAIKDNPDDWRVYQDLGFIFWRQKRYQEASEIYSQGSRLAGAPKWMEQMSAIMLANGGDRETARQMFARIYETTDDPTIKKTSLNRLLGFKAGDEISFLTKLLADYSAQKGSCPHSLSLLMRAMPPSAIQKLQQAGMSFDESRTPLDPHGFAYSFKADTCTISLAPDSTIAPWKN